MSRYHDVILLRRCCITDSPQTPDELKVTDLPDPRPKPDEYVIQVHAAAANFFDILQIQGKYQHQPRVSQSPCFPHKACTHNLSSIPMGLRRRVRRHRPVNPVRCGKAQVPGRFARVWRNPGRLCHQGCGQGSLTLPRAGGVGLPGGGRSVCDSTHELRRPGGPRWDQGW